jgi:hypothetical protein
MFPFIVETTFFFEHLPYFGRFIIKYQMLLTIHIGLAHKYVDILC